MSNSNPNNPLKLFTHKPKRGSSNAEATVVTATSRTEGSKQSFVHRYRFVWPALLLVNLAVGGSLFLRTKKKTTELDEGEVAAGVKGNSDAIKEKTGAAQTNKETILSTSAVPSPTVIPVVYHQISEDEQRQLFKWILEEKRNSKAATLTEKIQIDEDKAILKQYLRYKEIPAF